MSRLNHEDISRLNVVESKLVLRTNRSYDKGLTYIGDTKGPGFKIFVDYWKLHEGHVHPAPEKLSKKKHSTVQDLKFHDEI